MAMGQAAFVVVWTLLFQAFYEAIFPPKRLLLISGDILPGLIIGGVCRAVHAGEEHVLRVFIFHTSRQFNVRVFFVG